MRIAIANFAMAASVLVISAEAERCVPRLTSLRVRRAPIRQRKDVHRVSFPSLRLEGDD
jgi:hypothetical protein